MRLGSLFVALVGLVSVTISNAHADVGIRGKHTYSCTGSSEALTCSYEVTGLANTGSRALRGVAVQLVFTEGYPNSYGDVFGYTVAESRPFAIGGRSTKRLIKAINTTTLPAGTYYVSAYLVAYRSNGSQPIIKRLGVSSTTFTVDSTYDSYSSQAFHSRPIVSNAHDVLEARN